MFQLWHVQPASLRSSWHELQSDWFHRSCYLCFGGKKNSPSTGKNILRILNPDKYLYFWLMLFLQKKKRGQACKLLEEAAFQHKCPPLGEENALFCTSLGEQSLLSENTHLWGHLDHTELACFCQVQVSPPLMWKNIRIRCWNVGVYCLCTALIPTEGRQASDRACRDLCFSGEKLRDAESISEVMKNFCLIHWAKPTASFWSTLRDTKDTLQNKQRICLPSLSGVQAEADVQSPSMVRAQN